MGKHLPYTVVGLGILAGSLLGYGHTGGGLIVAMVASAVILYERVDALRDD